MRTAPLGQPKVSLCLICEAAEWRFGSWSHFSAGELIPPIEGEAQRFLSFDDGVDFFRQIFERYPPPR